MTQERFCERGSGQDGCGHRANGQFERSHDREHEELVGER
jgi:hypothetical protein